MLRLFSVLRAITQDKFLRDRLAIKGGTALNVFHLNLNRLSLDIDLEYIGHVEDKYVQADRDVIEGKLLQILDDQGYRLNDNSRCGQGGSNLIADFDSALGGTSNLRIDLGYVYRQPLLGVSRMPSAEIGGRGVTGMLVFDIMDVFVGKLTALTQRVAARDLHDVKSIVAKWDEMNMDMGIVRPAFIVAVTASREGWKKRRLESRGDDPYKEYEKLARCIPRIYSRSGNEIVTWFNDSIDLCRERFGDLLVLAPGEQRFVDGVIKRGKNEAGLLTSRPWLRDRIAAWPKLEWVCRRARRDQDQGM